MAEEAVTGGGAPNLQDNDEQQPGNDGAQEAETGTRKDGEEAKELTVGETGYILENTLFAHQQDHEQEEGEQNSDSLDDTALGFPTQSNLQKLQV